MTGPARHERVKEAGAIRPISPRVGNPEHSCSVTGMRTLASFDGSEGKARMSDVEVRTTPRAPDSGRPFVVDFGDAGATDPELTGGKAASLARASSAGLAVLPGVVLTTAFSDAVDAGAKIADHPAVRTAFEQADGENTSLVARSSSVVEDTSASSMAGQFESIIGISGF